MELFLNELWNSLTLLGRLLLNYVSYGAPFAAFHALVAVMLVRQTWYRKIRVETRALEHWRPRGPAGGAAETTRILDEFVADCDNMGGQGFFIPMTDFSDRLDSIVDGITAEMHDRTNLFILVGVAGTLLGVFEFAFRSHEVIQANSGDPGKSLSALSDILTSSMSKAFPVGFVGLLLTFLSQVIASIPERRLRTALANATGKALEAREGASRSQVNALQDSVGKMQEAMSTSVTAMKDALLPLANLQQTLGGVFEPTMNALSQHLADSLGLVSAQHEEMKKTNEGTQEIVGIARQAVADLRQAVERQIKQAEQTRESNENTIRVMREQHEALAVFNAALDASRERVDSVNRSVADAAAGVEALPDRLHGAAQLAFDRLAVDTLFVWQAASDELKHGIAGEHERLLDGAARQAGEVHATLMSAAAGLAGVAAGVGASVDGLTRLPENLEAEMKRVFGALATNSTEHWNLRTDDYMRLLLTHQANFFDNIRQKTADIEQSLGNAAGQLANISQRMDNILRDSLRDTIKAAREEIATSLVSFNRVIVEQYPALTENVVALTDGLKAAVASSGEIQKESASWLAGIQAAYERLEEINRLLTDALARTREETSPTNAEQVRALLQQNVDGLKGLGEQLVGISRLIPAPGQVQSVTNVLQDGLGRTTELLERAARVLEGIRRDLAPKAVAVVQSPPPRRSWRSYLWPFGRRGGSEAVPPLDTPAAPPQDGLRDGGGGRAAGNSDGSAAENAAGSEAGR
ncbi:MAG TPA: hypothetical protein VNZ44_00740 [Pyrinomonadaceae bacterium]|nr:hypothetical protein [Pyrinomonadaceae bacterium]